MDCGVIEMNEKFDAIPMTSKSWGITDEGVVYNNELHTYDTIKKISHFSQATHCSVLSILPCSRGLQVHESTGAFCLGPPLQ